MGCLLHVYRDITHLDSDDDDKIFATPSSSIYMYMYMYIRDNQQIYLSSHSFSRSPIREKSHLNQLDHRSRMKRLEP